MPDNLQGLDDLAAPEITPLMREYALALVMREIDAPLLLDILGLGD